MGKRGPTAPAPTKTMSDDEFQQIIGMVRANCTVKQICEALGISDNTLDRRIRERGYDNFGDLFADHYKKDEDAEYHRREATKSVSDNDFDKLIGMIHIQCTAKEISSILGMSDDTLDRRLKERGYDNFADCFKKHGDEGKASLRRVQWKAAQDGQPTMLVWLGKQILGQRDKSDVDLSVQGSGVLVAPAGITPQEWAKRENKDNEKKVSPDERAKIKK